jgi:hypothetical protein
MLLCVHRTQIQKIVSLCINIISPFFKIKIKSSMNSLLLLLIVGLISDVCGQQLSSFFDSVRRSHCENLVQKVVQQNHSSAKNYFSALKLHSLTSSGQIPCNCNCLTDDYLSATNVMEILYGEKINKLCNCGLKISNLNNESFEKIIEVMFLICICIRLIE